MDHSEIKHLPKVDHTPAELDDASRVLFKAAEKIEREACAADTQHSVRRAYEQERANKLRGLLVELGEYAPKAA